MLEFVGFLVFCAALGAAMNAFDGAGVPRVRNALLVLVAVSVLGGILWEYVARGFVLPFIW